MSTLDVLSEDEQRIVGTVHDFVEDAPLMIVGEGTNEIQRNIIAGQLVRRGGLDA